MRPIARQSSRLTSCQRLRQSSRPRNPCVQQCRAFRPSGIEQTESRSPNGDSPGHHESFNREEERDVYASHEQTKTEQPEGQEHAEARRVGMRKTFRQRKATEVPRPPALPEWFLRHNVTLRVEEASGGVSGRGKQLRCVDTISGHTMFYVPYYAVQESAEERDATKDNSSEMAVSSTVREGAKDADAAVKRNAKMDNKFFEQVFGQSLEATSVEGHETRGATKPAADDKDRAGQDAAPLGFRPSSQGGKETAPYPLLWTLLEIEASARAAMSLAKQERGSSSFAASRSDLSLYCPDPNAHDAMDDFARSIATILDADLIRLDANDLGDLTDEYVGQGSDSPGSFSTLGYDVFNDYRAAAIQADTPGFWRGADGENEEFDEEEEDEEEEESSKLDIDLGSFGNMDDLRKALHDKRHDLAKALGKIGVAGISFGLPAGVMASRGSSSQPHRKSASTTSDYITWDDVKLSSALDSLLDAPKDRRSADIKSKPNVAASAAVHHPECKPEYWFPEVSSSIVHHMSQGGDHDGSGQPLAKFELARENTGAPSGQRPTRTIVHVRDLKDICNSRLGDAMIKRLVKVVQKRRRVGQEILIVGTSARELDGPIEALSEAEDHPFRTIVVPPLFGMRDTERKRFDKTLLPRPASTFPDQAYNRILEINGRHISSMLRRLQPESPLAAEVRFPAQLFQLSGTHILGEKVLPLDQVQRLVLTAIGLSQAHALSKTVQPVHIALSAAFLSKADHTTRSWSTISERREARKNWPGSSTKPDKEAAGPNLGQVRLESIKKDCNQHETRLLAGVVDPQNIRTGFADVHAPPEAIEALKTLTTLSLLRPDAFKYGVLAADRLPGLMLYGPPGTGKTLLAKAVAKEAQATVLEISGAQIYEKYVGEGEKMVRAVFSLAKKLSPCIVFIDEADAIFGSRGGGAMGGRNTHREIINQFLREWDGMDDHRVFIMVASNRPFDLDDAVLRRLPRRLLVDLPVAKDRQGILGIHLRDEALEPNVSLEKLAEQTPLYSGSDLKNLCVAAALAAVREENELVAAAAAAQPDGKDADFKLPEKRTLTQAHFDKALQEISASISEDMGSLTAIRKFDEQFGDRKGRRKKPGVGFGLGEDSGVNESDVRVRQGP